MSEQRTEWAQGTHESKVESFYQAGIGHDQDWHGGYRNFGWWEEGDTEYLKAADRLVLEMNRLLGLKADSHLLDVACGGAPQDILLHRTTGARIDAMDVTWAQVVEARRRVKQAGLEDRITVHHGSATQIDFPPGTFSHVLCIEGAQHFNTREDFFKKVFVAMKPGGVMALADFIVTTPASRPWERFVVRRAQQLWNVPDANVLDERGYQASLERAGFTNITFEAAGRYTIPGYYRDQNTPETVKAHREFKGKRWRAKMFWTNYFMHKAWAKGLMEYALVRAEKPA